MRRTPIAIPLMLLVLLPAAPGTAPATPPQPTYGGAVVDGRYDDWDLDADRFADMPRPWTAAKRLECGAYLRYDCRSQILYVLVLAEPGVAARRDVAGSPRTSWVAIGASDRRTVAADAGRDGEPPDFAWIDPGFDGNPSHVRGFEASFRLAPTNDTIFIHQQPFDAVSGSDVSLSTPHAGPRLVIACETTPTEPATWSLIKSLYR